MAGMAVMEVKAVTDARAAMAAVAAVAGSIDTHCSSHPMIHPLDSFWNSTGTRLAVVWVNVWMWLNWCHEQVNR